MPKIKLIGTENVTYQREMEITDVELTELKEYIGKGQDSSVIQQFIDTENIKSKFIISTDSAEILLLKIQQPDGNYGKDIVDEITDIVDENDE